MSPKWIVIVVAVLILSVTIINFVVGSIRSASL